MTQEGMGQFKTESSRIFLNPHQIALIFRGLSSHWYAKQIEMKNKEQQQSPLNGSNPKIGTVYNGASLGQKKWLEDFA